MKWRKSSSTVRSIVLNDLAFESDWTSVDNCGQTSNYVKLHHLSLCAKIAAVATRPSSSAFFGAFFLWREKIHENQWSNSPVERRRETGLTNSYNVWNSKWSKCLQTTSLQWIGWIHFWYMTNFQTQKASALKLLIPLVQVAWARSDDWDHFGPLHAQSSRCGQFALSTMHINMRII